MELIPSNEWRALQAREEGKSAPEEEEGIPRVSAASAFLPPLFPASRSFLLSSPHGERLFPSFLAYSVP